MNKGYMTFAADMALIRHESFVAKVNQLILAFQVSVVMGKCNEKESRIVNKQGKILAEYEHK